MAKAKSVQIVEKNEGTKIEFAQSGTKLIFGDEEIMINAAKYQRDWPVQVDICADDNRNLVVGVGAGRYYVAQVDIPAVEYEEQEASETTSEGEEAAQEQEKTSVAKEIDMSGVVVTLWAVDDLFPAVD
jgi:hypothetical protein